MAIAVINWVWNHSRSSNGARLTLLAIADSAGEDGTQAWPSNAELQRKTNLGERAVQNAISTLVELGELEVEWNAGPRHCNRYRVIMAPPDPADSAPPQNMHPAKSAPPQNLRGSRGRKASSQVRGGKRPTPAKSAPPSIVRDPPAKFAPGSVLDPSIDHHHPRARADPPAGDGPAPDDDDRLLKTIIGTIRERTGRTITKDDARSVAAELLGQRRLRDANAYARTALRREPSPLDRFGLRSLPSSAATQPPLVMPVEPASQHQYAPDGHGSCHECGLPESNRRHLEATG